MGDNHRWDGSDDDGDYTISAALVIESTASDGATVVALSNTIWASTFTVSSGQALPHATTTMTASVSSSQSSSPSPTSSASSTPTTLSTTSKPVAANVSPTTSAAPPPPLSGQSQQDQNQDQGHDSHHDGSSVPIGAFVVIPIVIAIACIAAFLYWRRRKAARRSGVVTQQMKMRSPEDGLSRGPPGYNESTGGLLMATPTSATPLTAMATNDSLAPVASRTNRTSQPVILNTSMGGAYFTGLDTSDAVSMASGAANSSAERRSIDVNSITSDEPPPPYRPRSVPSISRESSIRQANQNLSVNTTLAPLSEGNLSTYRGDDDDDMTPTAETIPRANPFDDPESDAVSDISTPLQSPRWRSRGDEDTRSMISEFSFEHEHR